MSLGNKPARLIQRRTNCRYTAALEVVRSFHDQAAFRAYMQRVESLPEQPKGELCLRCLNPLHHGGCTVKG